MTGAPSVAARGPRLGFIHGWPAELGIALALFAVTAAWGASRWRQAVAEGAPFFYQTYFEPSVMVACGKGFVVAQPPISAVTAFLAQRVDRLSCESIPPDAILGTQELFQGAWRYLLVFVGVAWRVLGISWSGLAPVFGLLFGVTTAATYAVFRLGIRLRVIAVVCALALAGSRLQLYHLASLRDYAKAPFTIVLILLLGALVKGRPSWRTVPAIALAYGAVLGIGYGFRTDFLADIPAFFIAAALFLDGGIARNLGLKAVAFVLCVAAFLAIGWPILSVVRREGGCQWHTALLGFPTGFSRPLGLQEPPFKLLRVYSDDFVYATVTSYAARLSPGVGHIRYCGPDYDGVTGRYLVDLARHFPADMIARGFASTLRIVELPFSWNRADDVQLFEVQLPATAGSHHIGLAAVAVATVLLTAARVRFGLFAIFFLLYFGGYPAIQFHTRHYFHLEFIGWWAIGFLSDAVWRLLHARKRPCGIRMRSSLQAIAVVGAALAMLTIVLWSARLYQQASARRLFEGYLAAERDEVPRTPQAQIQAVPRAVATDPQSADLLVVDVSPWRCSGEPTVTFSYDRRRREFSRRVRIPAANATEPTRVIMPVYDGFLGVDASDSRPGCVDVTRVRNPSRFPLLLEATLAPRWRRQPLYARFGEIGGPEVDAVP